MMQQIQESTSGFTSRTFVKILLNFTWFLIPTLCKVQSSLCKAQSNCKSKDAFIYSRVHPESPEAKWPAVCVGTEEN